jgi:hypothetical protein
VSKLEATAGPPGGCLACRDRRGRVVLTTSFQHPDGTVVSEGHRPQPCAVCGLVPERIIEVVETVVTSAEGQDDETP